MFSGSGTSLLFAAVGAAGRRHVARMDVAKKAKVREYVQIVMIVCPVGF